MHVTLALLRTEWWIVNQNTGEQLMGPFDQEESAALTCREVYRPSDPVTVKQITLDDGQ